MTGRRAADEVLQLAASAEASSHHPLALAVMAEARRRSLPLANVRDAAPLPGRGCTG